MEKKMDNEMDTTVIYWGLYRTSHVSQVTASMIVAHAQTLCSVMQN